MMAAYYLHMAGMTAGYLPALDFHLRSIARFHGRCAGHSLSRDLVKGLKP